MDISIEFLKLQQMKFDLFKEQNRENGLFDVTFEVEGKLLYANRNMLDYISPTFTSMLSERWTQNKDEPIKIKDYSYNDFYQFLTFLYTGKCKLTHANIFTMIDIAEFYGVQIFKKYCEKYLAAMEITVENVFQMMDLAEKYSMVQIKARAHDYIIKHFQSFANSNGFLKADKSVLKELVASVEKKVKPEVLFQAIYKWCETQASNKQSADRNLNLNKTIKSEIATFLPHISFDKMEMKFLLEFVAYRGFIFPSYGILSKILSDRFSKPLLHSKIKITNKRGQTLHGKISDEIVLKNIESIKLLTCFRGYDGCCFWNTKCKIPTTPCPLKKKDGVKWYLVYLYDGDIGVTRSSNIGEEDYLLAELTSGTSRFNTAVGCKIEVE